MAWVGKAADPDGRARLARQEGKGCKEAEGQQAQTAEVRKGHAELPLPSFSPGALCGPSDRRAGLRRQETPDNVCGGQISRLPIRTFTKSQT